MSEKKKILIISDHPLAPSGVGTQTKYVISALIKTGRYKFACLGGAMSHPNYDPQQITDPAWEEDDWIVYPVDGYGNAEIIRSILWTEKPDVLWFMTDPRFYPWLWQIENEIRPNVPMVYYHVWDNYPPPKYNRKWYRSTDVIASISKVTHDIVSKVSPETENHYIPHAVNGDIFKKLDKKIVNDFKEENFLEHNDRVIFFWNNRNARRKQSGTLIHWFNKFAEEVGPDKVCLVMHTDPKDANGQDLEAILHDFDIADGRIVLSKEKMPSEGLALMYNMADCTINISDAEGFGLATFESLSCGTPIIVNMTGGLQEQVTDGKDWFGIGLEPASKTLIGSQTVPYIYEDRLSEEQLIGALKTIYEATPEEREEMGRKGIEHIRKNYNFKDFENRWIELMDDVIERLGSWDTRAGYKTWELKEIA
jgi:glycosyltransferase involved in cell wall biosynthesis